MPEGQPYVYLIRWSRRATKYGSELPATSVFGRSLAPMKWMVRSTYFVSFPSLRLNSFTLVNTSRGLPLEMAW